MYPVHVYYSIPVYHFLLFYLKKYEEYNDNMQIGDTEYLLMENTSLWYHHMVFGKPFIHAAQKC